LYIDAIFDKNREVVHVVERINGRRLYETYPIMWEAYYEDRSGEFTTIYNTKASKISARSKSKFNQALKALPRGTRLFEHDTNPVFDCLEKHYSNVEAPDLNIGFFDIETDFDPDRGFSPASDPFAMITAISIYISNLKKNITLVIPPPTLSYEEGKKIGDQFPDTYTMDSEEELLKTFLELIDDVDVLTGWNSEGYDIPYTINRIHQLLGRDYVRKMCLWDMLPNKREFEKYGKKQYTYDLVGRVHLDYLALYQKYTYHEMHSYKLNDIGEYEVNEQKISYEGSLDHLYKHDYYKFIEYNRQDVMLLVKIDDKLKFIEIANRVAHDNTVLLQTTMGAVAVTDQAIINESHRLGLVVPSRKPREVDEFEGMSTEEIAENIKNDYDAETAKSAVGAFVANPKKGLHDWIGATDINSLYPSVLRSLNMSPETVHGQLRLTYTNDLIRNRLKAQTGKRPSVTAAWEEVFLTLEVELIQKKDNITSLELVFEDGDVVRGTGAELYKLIYEQNRGKWALSANGTLFRQDREGIVPGLLARWYSERKQRQGHLRKFANVVDGSVEFDVTGHNIITWIDGDDRQPAKKESVYHFDFEELNRLKNNSTTEEISTFLHVWSLKVVDGFVMPTNMFLWKEAVEYWDKQQLVRKIGLNSLYGALLNKGSRFNDVRLGQSTTLTGRCITRHMACKTNEILDGEYDYKGRSIIYGDSVTGDSKIQTNKGEIAIEDLFNMIPAKARKEDGKEYALLAEDDDITTLGFNAYEDRITINKMNYVMRHKTSKQLYKITMEDSTSVTVTEDHSLMVDRAGFITEVKPTELEDDDYVITICE
jgi:DNA polymerase elongation subunit (family B)